MSDEPETASGNHGDLLYETYISPHLLIDWTLDEFLAQADRFLPWYAADLAGISDATVTASGVPMTPEDAVGPVLLQWWRGEATADCRHCGRPIVWRQPDSHPTARWWHVGGGVACEGLVAEPAAT